MNFKWRIVIYVIYFIQKYKYVAIPKIKKGPLKYIYTVSFLLKGFNTVEFGCKI